MEHGWVAMDACTLPTAQRPLRLAEFDTLFTDHVVGVERMSVTRLRLAMLGPSGLDRQVQDLAASESHCCSFFTFSVSTVGASSSRSGGRDIQVNLDVEVPLARANVLASLADRAEALSTAESALGSTAASQP